MAVPDKDKQRYTWRILLSRMRILCNQGFYGLLLMHMKVSLSSECNNAFADDKRILFNPEFLDSISDPELDYVMMHLISHVVLRHATRREGRDEERFYRACDTVVNSNILLSAGNNENAISLQNHGGVQQHLAPDGKEGHEYSVEELYQMYESQQAIDMNGENSKGKGSAGKGEQPSSGWDDHEAMEQSSEEGTAGDSWMQYFRDACEAISVRESSSGRGTLPLFAQRLLKELKAPQVDWRTILNDFVQEEITDYSLSPPDRRFSDSPFFLPDYSEKEDAVENILFMIDTSGSMSDEDITAAFSEIKGAIEQFNGRLKGLLGFFDAAAYVPTPFEDVDSLTDIRPVGGGGTDFQVVFDYVNSQMTDDPPVSIIMMTDGYAPFPDEKEANGIPVLWLLTNEENTPPWGRVARISGQGGKRPFSNRKPTGSLV